jgi:hypothetical protein
VRELPRVIKKVREIGHPSHGLPPSENRDLVPAWGIAVPRIALRPQNTEISSEDRAILASAGFVCFISLLDGMCEGASYTRDARAMLSRSAWLIPDATSLSVSAASWCHPQT